MNATLEALARRHGVQTRYHDIDGQLRGASSDVLCAVLRALGVPIEGPADAADALASLDAARPSGFVAPVLVAWDGVVPPVAVHDAGPDARRVTLSLRLDDGRTMAWRGIGVPAGHDGRPVRAHEIPVTLPPGCHTLTLEGDDPADSAACTLVAAPAVLPPPAGRAWGVHLPLHAYGDRTRGGVADYEGLARACAWVGELGGACVATLPLLAAFLDEPFEFSPYAPASRLFWNDLYVDPRTAPGAVDTTDVPDVPDSGPLVDYRAVAALRRRALEEVAARFHAAGGEDDGAFVAWRAAHPHADDYARFRAACDRFRAPWTAWPDRLRAGTLEPGDVDAATFRYHRYAAWVADRQLAAIAAQGGASAGLYLDQPIGVHAHSYDTWRERALFASGVTVGAPPDPFFRGGQNWGFPPIIPAVSRMTGHRHVRACLRHHMQHARVLRLDHVMSLQRLYWIPEGAAATDGVYVESPHEELLAVLVLEATRTGTTIVGEDLGTVTPEIRAALDRRGIQRMYVAQFEFRPGHRPPMAPVPGPVAASVNTHDLPPFAAFWHGLDLEDQHALGQLDDEALVLARRERAALRADVCDAFGIRDPDTPCAAEHVFRSLSCILAESDAALLVLNLEDLWGETRPQNVPGTTTERPNWRRRAQVDLDALLRDGNVAAALQLIARLRAPVAEPV